MVASSVWAEVRLIMGPLLDYRQWRYNCGGNRRRQADYYEALARSGATGSCESFVEFMLEAIRESILPYAKPSSSQDMARARALAFLRDNPQSTVTQLSQYLGCSKRSAERIVAQLKEEGALERQGSPRSGVWVVHASGL